MSPWKAGAGSIVVGALVVASNLKARIAKQGENQAFNMKPPHFLGRLEGVILFTFALSFLALVAADGVASNPAPVTVSLSPAFFGAFKQNQNSTVALSISFSSSSFTVTALTFQGAGAKLLSTKSRLPAGFTQGNGTLELNLTTADATAGNYTSVVQVYGIDPFGLQDVAVATYTWTVQPAAIVGFNIPEETRPYLIVGAAVAVTALLCAALLVRRRR
jgi:hypothetical protein